MVPNYSDLTYFVEVAQTKNISRAAERLGIAQPSLSSAIKRLENSFNVSLLIRSRSGVQLTKAGQELYSKSKLFIFNWDQLKSEIVKRQTSIIGRYSIGCHSSVALYTLSYFLPKLICDHQDLEVEIIHDLSRKITERIISFEIDFGIVVNPVRHPDLVIKELCNDEVSFWISKKINSHQKFDFKKMVLICDPNLIQTQKLILSLEKKKIYFRRIIKTTDLEVVADLVNAGLGVGILPKRVATRASGYNLQILNDQLPSFHDRICLVYRQDAQKTTASQIIISSIIKNIN